jgi:hypothetical protein
MLCGGAINPAFLRIRSNCFRNLRCSCPSNLREKLAVLTQSGRFSGLAETGDAFVSYHSLLKHINRRTPSRPASQPRGVYMRRSDRPRMPFSSAAALRDGPSRSRHKGKRRMNSTSTPSLLLLCTTLQACASSLSGASGGVAATPPRAALRSQASHSPAQESPLSI